MCSICFRHRDTMNLVNLWDSRIHSLIWTTLAVKSGRIANLCPSWVRGCLDLNDVIILISSVQLCSLTTTARRLSWLPGCGWPCARCLIVPFLVSRVQKGAMIQKRQWAVVLQSPLLTQRSWYYCDGCSFLWVSMNMVFSAWVNCDFMVEMSSLAFSFLHMVTSLTVWW